MNADSKPRCGNCGMVLFDPLLVTLGYCTSECEREAES
jgi:hypothetical protein